MTHTPQGTQDGAYQTLGAAVEVGGQARNVAANLLSKIVPLPKGARPVERLSIQVGECPPPSLPHAALRCPPPTYTPTHRDVWKTLPPLPLPLPSRACARAPLPFPPPQTLWGDCQSKHTPFPSPLPPPPPLPLPPARPSRPTGCNGRRSCWQGPGPPRQGRQGVGTVRRAHAHEPARASVPHHGVTGGRRVWLRGPRLLPAVQRHDWGLLRHRHGEAEKGFSLSGFRVALL